VEFSPCEKHSGKESRKRGRGGESDGGEEKVAEDVGRKRDGGRGEGVSRSGGGREVSAVMLHICPVPAGQVPKMEGHVRLDCGKEPERLNLHVSSCEASQEKSWHPLVGTDFTGFTSAFLVQKYKY